ncbi:MAG: OmpA family protein [Alistipes sp.]|nr:OmpA family protein [Alistipes sp.]MBR2331296.1 OmpA family protein [Alistipes sp.]
MKKLLLSIALVAFSVANVAAQETSADKLRWKGIMNNGFWSNWELSVAGGVNATAWDGIGTDQDATGDLGWQIEGGLTKWFNPILGARVQLIGGQLNASDDYLKSNWIMPHADAVINLSNWIGGYREDRVYYAKVFAGAGVNFTNVNNEAGSGFAGVAGLINTFRVCKQLDINLELKGILSAGRDMPRGINVLAGDCGQIYSATLGIAYRFNKRNWDKAYSQEEVDGYLASIAALEAGLAEAHRNEGKLAERLAAQKAATDKALADNEALRAELAKRKTSVVSSTALFFNLNSARLLDRAKSAMQLLAETIAAAPKDQVFTLVGHADDETGSPEYNQKLSEKRAKAVYDYLVEQGVNKDQLTWKGVGSSQNIFPINSTNRVVIVK